MNTQRRPWSHVRWGAELSHKQQLLLSDVGRASLRSPPEDSRQSIKRGQEKDSSLGTAPQGSEFVLLPRASSRSKEMKQIQLTNGITSPAQIETFTKGWLQGSHDKLKEFWPALSLPCSLRLPGGLQSRRTMHALAPSLLY